MAVDVVSYIEQLKKKKGKLDRWEAEIFQLFHANASYQDIAEYLNLNDTKATKMEVYRFIHRKKRRTLLHRNMVPETVPENGEHAKTSNKDTSPAMPPNASDSPPSQSFGMPRFNWRKNQKKDKPTW